MGKNYRLDGNVTSVINTVKNNGTTSRESHQSTRSLNFSQMINTRPLVKSFSVFLTEQNFPRKCEYSTRQKIGMESMQHFLVSNSLLSHRMTRFRVNFFRDKKFK